MSVQLRTESIDIDQSNGNLSVADLLLRTEVACRDVFSQVAQEKERQILLGSNVTETRQLIARARGDIKQAKASVFTAGSSILISAGGLCFHDSSSKETRDSSPEPRNESQSCVNHSQSPYKHTLVRDPAKIIFTTS